MFSGYEHTLTNLRLLSGLRKNEYLQTDSNGNILSYLEDKFIQNIASALYRENWDSTLFCLRKIYETEVSKLMLNLIDEDAEKELLKMRKLLDDSRIGLTNLKTVYKERQYITHLDTLIEDYLNIQIEHIDEIISS